DDRLIHGGGPLDDLAVAGDQLAGFGQNQVSLPQVRGHGFLDAQRATLAFAVQERRTAWGADEEVTLCRGLAAAVDDSVGANLNFLPALDVVLCLVALSCQTEHGARSRRRGGRGSRRPGPSTGCSARQQSHIARAFSTWDHFMEATLT